MVALTSEIVYDLKTLEDIARQIPENHAELDNLHRCGKTTICRSFPHGFPMGFRHLSLQAYRRWPVLFFSLDLGYVWVLYGVL